MTNERAVEYLEEVVAFNRLGSDAREAWQTLKSAVLATAQNIPSMPWQCEKSTNQSTRGSAGAGEVE